jgi:hypothetical protein
MVVVYPCVGVSDQAWIGMRLRFAVDRFNDFEVHPAASGMQLLSASTSAPCSMAATSLKTIE